MSFRPIPIATGVVEGSAAAETRPRSGEIYSSRGHKSNFFDRVRYRCWDLSFASEWAAEAKRLHIAQPMALAGAAICRLVVPESPQVSIKLGEQQEVLCDGGILPGDFDAT